MKSIRYSETRRQIAVVGAWNTLALDYRSPYTVAFWSIAYAGLGHIILDRYYRGFILMIGEIFLNLVSHLNRAIFYTISGRFSSAKEVINTKALLLYIGIYCFAIFDSYRATIVVNNTYRLADRENAKIKCFTITSNSYTILQKSSPYLALIWSAVIPGAGCFLIERMNRALYLIILWVFNAYMAGLYTAIIYSASGQFELAKEALNIQWLLNLPSIWFYGLYEVYNCSLENNKIYKRELMNFIDEEYQMNTFSLSEVLEEA